MTRRLFHAVRYVLRGVQPPNPNATADNKYFITLGRTGCMLAASAARDEVLTGGAA